jgi:outer membrane protein assembly factor BamB
LSNFDAAKALIQGPFRNFVRPVCSVLIVALASCSGGSSNGPTTAQLQGLPATVGHPSALSPNAPREGTSKPTDWDSFGFDLQRTGYNPYESTVGVNNVGSLQQVWSYNVGGIMVHEPVYAYGVKVGRKSRNIVYAGSSIGATMYAINADTGTVIWEKAVAHIPLPCGNNAQISIGETPAIDRGKNLLYFSDGHDKVHAVDLATGAEAKGWPLTIANWHHDYMHGGFTYNPNNGLLYAVTSSPCDLSPWHGRIVAIDTRNPAITNEFYTMGGINRVGTSGGGIWGPGGASIDPSTDRVFVATGNADTNFGSPRQAQNAVHAEQLLELSPQLDRILAHNYPTNIPSNGLNDFDFGATPLLFQPLGCPAMVAVVNKSGMFELYDEASINKGPIQYIAMSVPSDAGNFVGVPAYDPVTGYVYVGLPTSQGIYQPGMAAFSMASNCTLNTVPVWSAMFGPEGTKTTAAPRSPISIANGVVYISNYTGDTEYAFDAATGSQLWNLTLPYFGRQGTVIANGMVFVSSSDGTIGAWAPSSSLRKLRKRTEKGMPSIGPTRVSIPDGMGGTIDLRSSPNALSNFGQVDK